MELQCATEGRVTASDEDLTGRLEERVKELAAKVQLLAGQLEALYRVTEQVAEHEARQQDYKLVLLNQSVLIPGRDYTWDCGRPKMLFTLHPEDIVRVLTIENARLQSLYYRDFFG